MRPLKHGPLSFVSHVFVRNSIYYYRTNISVDLLHYFPTTEIKKSLKTKESKTAKLVAISKWYQRYNRHYVTNDPKKEFHSMRHLVTDTLKQAGVIETVIAELVGHSNSGSMTMGRVR